MKLTIKVPTYQFEISIESEDVNVVVDSALFALMLLKEKLEGAGK